MDVYAAWTYRSGDHATVPTQYVENPCLPGTSQLSDLEPMYGNLTILLCLPTTGWMWVSISGGLPSGDSSEFGM